MKMYAGVFLHDRVLDPINPLVELESRRTSHLQRQITEYRSTEARLTDHQSPNTKVCYCFVGHSPVLRIYDSSKANHRGPDGSAF